MIFIKLVNKSYMRFDRINRKIEERDETRAVGLLPMRVSSFECLETKWL